MRGFPVDEPTGRRGHIILSTACGAAMYKEIASVDHRRQTPVGKLAQPTAHIGRHDR
jgi:hypothetical protein